MMQIVDPASYPEKLRGVPKLVINSGADEFLIPDDTRFWWDAMQGEKHFIMVPDAEHSEATGILEILPAIATFLNAVLDQQPRPEFKWEIDDTSGDITLQLPPTATDVEAAFGVAAGRKLQGVHMWHATTCNDKRRDFRVVNLGWGEEQTCLPCGVPVKGGPKKGGLCTNLAILWTKEALAEVEPGSGKYVAHRDAPAGGKWTAFFIDVIYESDLPPPAVSNGSFGWPLLPQGDFEFTTEVSVVPRVFPFPDCHGAACAGTLV
jgi:hypothetical protein